MIVLHYTAGGSAQGTRSYFDHPEIEASARSCVAAGKVNVSSHYLVDRDGTIYQLQPETRFARHCIGLNHLAIGVENVGDATPLAADRRAGRGRRRAAFASSPPATRSRTSSVITR